MTPPTSPTSGSDAARQAADQPLADTPSDRLDGEPTWVADELHLLRLLCQLTDYEVTGALAANPAIATFRSGDGPRAPASHDPQPGQPA